MTNASKILGDKPKIILATDHGYFGVVRGLERPREVLEPLLGHTDILMTDLRVMRVLGNAIPADLPVILRASGGGSTIDVPVPGHQQETARRAYRDRTGKDPKEVIKELESRMKTGEELSPEEWEEYNCARSIFFIPDTLAEERMILTPDEVERAGAHAAAISVYIGSPYQSQTLDSLATFKRLAAEKGMPVLGVVAVGKGLGHKEKDADYLMRSGAITAAHGADFIKIYNCREGFKDVVDACGVPVVVAGGKVPKGKDPIVDTLELAADSIDKGARGLDFGRRVWRNEHPIAMIRAMKDVVSGQDVDTAVRNYQDYSKQKSDKIQ